MDTQKEEKTVSWREWIETVSHVALVLVLVLSFYSFRLQSQTLEVKIFEEVNQDLVDLVKTPPQKNDYEAWVLWEKRLVGIYEYFAFLANHEYMRREFVDFYALAVVRDLDTIKEKYPSVLEMFHESHGSELRTFYRNRTGKDLINAAHTRPK